MGKGISGKGIGGRGISGKGMEGKGICRVATWADADDCGPWVETRGYCVAQPTATRQRTRDVGQPDFDSPARNSLVRLSPNSGHDRLILVRTPGTADATRRRPPDNTASVARQDLTPVAEVPELLIVGNCGRTMLGS